MDVWHVPGVYAACKEWSDIGNGPNKPTATTIGEYSASYHGALIFTLQSGGDCNPGWDSYGHS